MTHILTFEEDGSAHTLWTDALPLAELGTLRVRRASWIDFNEHTQRWEVRLDPHADDPVFSHFSRQACLTWENETLNC
ncbi:MAG: hypothetical protein QOE70_947 [Chthoniobacter sp.]|jgi:hypothetical protein|nr:hypothetical protein [Chthoniobacter sp.]